MTVIRLSTRFLFLFLGWFGGSAAFGSTTLPHLNANQPFAVTGAEVALQITGDAGQCYTLLLSTQPAQSAQGTAGISYLNPNAMTVIGSGLLDTAGQATAWFSFPAQTPVGSLRYLQAQTGEGATRRLSNAVTLQAVASPPSGARATHAMAVTPNGVKAYVVHENDGALSIIDAQTDQKIAERPLGPSARHLPHRPVDVRLDPAGKRVFVVNAASESFAVLDSATDSVIAQVAVGRGARRIAFSGPYVYLTNDLNDELQVIAEPVKGLFIKFKTVPLQGRDPGPVVVLPNKLLLIGHRASHELELVHPFNTAGPTTLARIPLGTLPLGQR